MISRNPFTPGIAWDWLHYFIGLLDLGHNVYFVEEVGPRWCVDVHGRKTDFERSVNRKHFRTVMERFGYMERACQLYNRGERTQGLSLDALQVVAETADLLINISGHVGSEFLLAGPERRVYVDQDPVYTQLWRAEYGQHLDFEKHDVFFTMGLNIGTPHTHIPDCGLCWHHTLPPVVLDHWPATFDSAARRFTTVASLWGYRDLFYAGEWYGSKYEEFKRFAKLPARSNRRVEVALRHAPEEDGCVAALREGGWLVMSASQLDSLSAYQEYIQASRGEIGIAKGAYVKGQSGWFSDRSAHYLASAKPVLAQATGFERCLPTGRGIISFADVEEAVAGFEAIEADYPGHCRAAREFAEEFLNHEKVLPRMLEACFQ